MAFSLLKLLRIPRAITQNITKQELFLLRHSSYESSRFLEDVQITAKYKVDRNPAEWKYVERLLPLTVVPEPTPKSSYASDWKPQGNNFENLPYFVARTKNHMIPVYLHIKRRGTVRHTVLRRIQGDIWQLEKDLRPFLEDVIKPKLLRLQVDESAGKICINGDLVNAIKYWLEKRNL